MPLTNFGAILNFAEQLEKQDLEFYQSAAENPNCESVKAMFKTFNAHVEKM